MSSLTAQPPTSPLQLVSEQLLIHPTYSSYRQKFPNDLIYAHDTTMGLNEDDPRVRRGPARAPSASSNSSQSSAAKGHACPLPDPPPIDFPVSDPLSYDYLYLENQFSPWARPLRYPHSSPTPCESANHPVCDPPARAHGAARTSQRQLIWTCNDCKSRHRLNSCESRRARKQARSGSWQPGPMCHCHGSLPEWTGPQVEDTVVAEEFQRAFSGPCEAGRRRVREQLGSLESLIQLLSHENQKLEEALHERSKDFDLPLR